MKKSEKRILIAEDEKPMASALKAKLEREGFVATVVSDGKQALEALHDGEFDLLILDILMPRVDGWQVLETLKEQNNAVPIVVASNLGQVEDERRARELGASDYFVKTNVPLAELVERVKKLL